MTELSDAQAEALLRLVADTAEEEILCEEFREGVAAYHAALTAGGPLSAANQRIAQHRKACPECEEEYEVLSELEGVEGESAPF